VSKQSFFIAIGAMLVMVACAAERTNGDSPSDQNSSATLRDSRPVDWSGEVRGVPAEIHIPDEPNGVLLIYARGLLNTPKAAVVHPPFADHLLDRGYAWAASAFGGPIFDPREAADHSIALLLQVEAAYGRADEVYIVGLSMGGSAAMLTAETTPERVDGALALCSTAGFSSFMAGGTDFLAATLAVTGVDEATLGDPAGPQSLADIWRRMSITDRRSVIDRMTIVARGRPDDVRAGLEAALDDRWSFIVALASAGQIAFSPQPGKDFAEYQAHPLAGHTTIYAPGGTDITGLFGVPVLTMHNTGDSVVLFREAYTIYEKAAASGRHGMLAQRAIRATHHCDFTQQELSDALDALRDWARTGVRPAHDDLNNDQPETLGDRFSDPARGLVD
jgi:pimeloyl-ACP methyl ester carboxylesterase